MNNPVYINSISTISPLGEDSREIWNSYRSPQHHITKANFNGKEEFAAFLPERLKEKIENLRQETELKNVDKTVLLAVYASRKLSREAGWRKNENIGINIGSSRGATGLFEKYHSSFLQTGKAEVLASPGTTLGNISSWVAQDMQSSGPEISHSVTCSTGLHAILNAVAWLQAGMAEKFLVGGSEAALTPFTIAQMRAMKIYATEDADYPCRALDLDKTRNSMVLGEAAGVLGLEKDPNSPLARIAGVGYATEKFKHAVSLSANAECLQRSMQMAVGNHKLSDIDAIVMHAPGTIKGDRAEFNAIKTLFGKQIPALTSNKWKIGHSFGASGILSLELTVLMMQHQEFIGIPFVNEFNQPKKTGKSPCECCWIWRERGK
ncbi:MAG TPA: beta-ketoacyl synthase N-terminal-like domain-containing protein, partial [Gillisia sp.]|nr:beta-ketoacyl synthase N-terminal-like domain-containing protein [Gillisia sp.]